MMLNSLTFALFLALATTGYVSTNPLNGQITGDSTLQALPSTNFQQDGLPLTAQQNGIRDEAVPPIQDQELFNAGKGNKRPGFPAKGGQKPITEEDKGFLDNLPFGGLIDGILPFGSGR